MPWRDVTVEQLRQDLAAIGVVVPEGDDAGALLRDDDAVRFALDVVSERLVGTELPAALLESFTTLDDVVGFLNVIGSRQDA